MAIGERIRFFRNLKGMTQKYLGMQVGFPEKTADIRMAQYESGSRTPKADLTNNLANVFGISTSALTVPYECQRFSPESPPAYRDTFESYLLNF